jgi:cytochrome c oxidase subunit I
MSSSTVDGLDPAHSGDHPSYLTAQRGLLSWLLTIDHKRIGVMYLGTILTFFMIGGLLAMGVRAELFTPEGDLFSPNTYNRVFTLHGAIMVFLVLVPAIPASLGNFLLPLHLGAVDVAFPKLNLASFHIYVLGALFLVYTLVTGGVDTGWTF